MEDDNFDITDQDHFDDKIPDTKMALSPIKKNNSENILTLLDKKTIDIEDKDEMYYLLLDEIYESIICEKELFENKNINVQKPLIIFENRKTFWTNYDKNCVQLNRQTTHVTKFLEKELGLKTSMNAKSHLIMKGRINVNLICETYKKYIKTYVQCGTCRTINTEITHNSSTRMDCLTCKKCKSSKVVTRI